MHNEAPLIGEGLALDLVNTRAQGAAGPIDHIGTTADLAAWLVLEAQHFSQPDAAALVALDDAGLAAVHRVRDSAAQLISALRRGDQAPEQALRALNRTAAAAPAVSEIAQDDDGTVRRSRRRQGPIGVRLAARLAEEVMSLVTREDFASLRECAADRCAMLFIPKSARRIWCSPVTCGNRERVSRYYRRHAQGPRDHSRPAPQGED